MPSSTDRPAIRFTEPGIMTSAGRFAHLIDRLPGDVAKLASVGHGLLIHEHLASAYGVTLSPEDRESLHVRPAERLLELITTRDDRPLDVPRESAARLAGNCRHFTVLAVTMLRAHGIAARARCGFAAYFIDGFFEDHWVCEYRPAGQERWAVLDPQLDERQREMFPIDFDVADVPRDRFLTAGDAWRRCRDGAADPGRFGLSMVRESGWWWIAGNLMRDAAALSGVEVLPWDSWGAMPGPDAPIDDDLRALFDRLADLTRDPDADLPELLRLCADDERLRLPAAVRNDLRGRDEPLVS
ncbi:transglutaminase domain-containing protein [Thermostaphylospora chromogena]|uniref:Transglutaminase-like superfamily protein n=1 Tax=Thermostaphylospora chromogena TaxID=35622 RepID=A0A1H0ZZD7_9ACTN|nr:transglutaminase domain-containing protein [Thermostaphylospora chromogena]SDQ32416.1 Transglutaminase-like superfamily protein [Thermostaphylospora chromogena]